MDCLLAPVEGILDMGLGRGERERRRGGGGGTQYLTHTVFLARHFLSMTAKFSIVISVDQLISNPSKFSFQTCMDRLLVASRGPHVAVEGVNPREVGEVPEASETAVFFISQEEGGQSVNHRGNRQQPREGRVTLKVVTLGQTGFIYKHSELNSVMRELNRKE